MNIFKLLYLVFFSTILYANTCPKWLHIPMQDGLVTIIPIYDKSITKSDLDCDSIIDTIDSDIDGDGIMNTADAFPFDPMETTDSDNDGLGDNADRPVANNQSYIFEKNTSNNQIVLTGDDDDIINFSLSSSPSHGNLSGIPPNLNYTPDANYTGIDSFTFKVNDTTLTSSLATITINIKDDITPPIITLIGSDPQYIEKGTPYVELNATVDDGSTITIDSSHVNTSINGMYTVTYNTMDDANNTAIEVTRKIIVDDDITTFYVTGFKEGNTIGSYEINNTLYIYDENIPSVTISPDNNTTYISTQDGGKIINTSLPTDPVYTTSYAESNNSVVPSDTVLSQDGNILYVAHGEEGFKIFDISSSNHPVLLDSYKGTVRVGSYDDETDVYTPDLYTSTCYAKSIVLSKDGNTAYVACGALSVDIYQAHRVSALQIIDVSTPTNIHLIGAYELDDGGFGTSIALSDNEENLYLASSYAGLKCLDISSPASPTLLTTFDSYHAWDIVVSKSNDNILYLADGRKGLKIIDISNPNNLKLISEYNTTKAYELTLTQDENNIYISTFNSGVNNIDISNPANPKFISVVNTEDTHVYSIALTKDETKLYTIGAHGFKIIDLTTSTQHATKNFSNASIHLLIHNTLRKEMSMSISTDRDDIISIGNYQSVLNFNDYHQKEIVIPINSILNAEGETVITIQISHDGKVLEKKVIFQVLP